MTFRGFAAYTNIGTTGRGTEILTLEHIQLTNIVCLLTGRGMAADFQNVTIVIIYAPSGADRRRDREKFFSNELPYLLRGIPPLLLVGGDFNSVLTNLDATGHPNYSRALQEFIRGFDRVDKICRENQNILFSVIFFSFPKKSYRLRDNVNKYCGIKTGHR